MAYKIWKAIAKLIKSLPFGIPELIRTLMRVVYSPFSWINLRRFNKIKKPEDGNIKELIKVTQNYYDIVTRRPFLMALRYPKPVEFKGDELPAAPLPKRPNDEVVVHYSGGSDSALVAALCAEAFGKVHLITFSHEAITKVEQSDHNFGYLKKYYGEDKFVRKFIDMDKVFKELYWDNQRKHAEQYNLLLAAPCISCRNAMHTETIAYCKANGIKYAIDGANIYNANLAYHEMIKNMQVTRDLYKSYGLEYLVNPNYYDAYSDNKLYDMGVLPGKSKKHGSYADFQEYNATQASCPLAVLFMLGVNSWYLPYHGAEKINELGNKHYKESLDMYLKKIIDKRIAEVTSSSS